MTADSDLLAAVLAGDAPAAAAALAAGADPRARRNYEVAIDRERVQGSETLLHCAVRGGALPVVELLLAHGAAVDTTDGLRAETPLSTAVTAGDAAMVALLLRHRAAVTPAVVEFASHAGRIDLLERFALQASDTVTMHGRDAIVAAARSGHVDALAWFAARGAPLVDAVDAALCEAANAGKVDAVRWLLANGASTSARTSFGWPPLHLAAYNGNAETVAALLAAGADANATDGQGLDARHWALEAGKRDSAAMLGPPQ